LRRDSEELPLLDPIQPSPEYLRWLEKKNVMLERVDAEGGTHTDSDQAASVEPSARPDSRSTAPGVLRPGEK
jgi:hypothetical protein